MTMNLKTLLASINRDAAATVAALRTAANEVREVLGQEPLAGDAALPPTVPGLVACLRDGMAQTARAFADLRAAVDAMTGTPAAEPTPATVQPLNGHEKQVEKVPEPLVAPTLAGGLLEPLAITPAVVAASETPPEAHPEPAHVPEREYLPVDEQRDLEGEAATRRAVEEEQAAEFAAEMERAAVEATSNGHVPHGEELAAVGVGVEEPGSGRRGGRGTRSPRKRS